MIKLGTSGIREKHKHFNVSNLHFNAGRKLLLLIPMCNSSLHRYGMKVYLDGGVWTSSNKYFSWQKLVWCFRSTASCICLRQKVDMEFSCKTHLWNLSATLPHSFVFLCCKLHFLVVFKQNQYHSRFTYLLNNPLT